jgi:hypothetical protein
VLAEWLPPLAPVPPIGFFDDLPAWNKEAAQKRVRIEGLTLYGVDSARTRLLGAPRDLKEAWKRPKQPVAREDAGAAHRRLWREYETDLRNSVDEALFAWNARLRDIRKQTGSELPAAVAAAYQESPAGPAGSRHMVWVVRKYWLACEALNPSAPPKKRVPPEVFLFGWLEDGAHEDELTVLAQLLYWPIGLNDRGRWV